MADWLDLGFLIDGIIEIHLKVPPAENGKESNRMQFIGTTDEPNERMFIASYDPGRGRDRDLNLVRISGVVSRINREIDRGSILSIAEIKNDIYLSRPDAAEHFEIIGEKVLYGHSLLQVNLIGEQRNGVFYSLPIHKNYVLNLRMSMWGEESSKTRLFRKRHETLKKILSTLQVTVEDYTQDHKISR